MSKFFNIAALLVLGIIFQEVLLPAYIADPFQPNLLILFVVYLGFHADMSYGAPSAFLLGLVHDSLSGLYFGLNGFSFLLIYLLYHELANRLYTGSRALMVVGTFLATVVNACVHLLILLLFSASQGVYASIIQAMVPQCFMNSLLAVILFFMTPLGKKGGML
jgi:rod shape-determining protein MreD